VQVLDTAPGSTLALDWRRYFNNEHLSDVILRVAGSDIPAHRVVLAARCGLVACSNLSLLCRNSASARGCRYRYFQRMFASGMREASQQQVVIDDAELRVFMAMLEHLYTDTVEIPSDIALALMCTADRFGVERLKALCAAKLEAELSPATACAVLVVADRTRTETRARPLPPRAPAHRTGRLTACISLQATRLRSCARRPSRTSSPTSPAPDATRIVA
jgi:hypothetical protein